MAINRKRMRHHLPSGAFVAIGAAIVVAVLAILVWFGAYNIAADVSHNRPVHWFLDSVRERSIETRAGDIAVPPDLNSPQRLAAGAGLYGEMCVACHLGPGVEPSELSQGLYPQAPELAKASDLSAAEQFWVIKHGIKMTAMPAWGKTHPDPLIWDMVAFVRKLPELSPEQYQRLIVSAPEGHDEMMEHAGAEHHH